MVKPEKLSKEEIKEVEQIVDKALRSSFAQRRVGDTPTDNFQLVPKKYVDTKKTFSIASSGTNFNVGGVIFDHFVDVGNTHTNGTVDTLYADTMPASILGNNADKIEAEYGGKFVSSGTASREVQVFFAGTSIFDTGTLTVSLSSSWTCYVTIIRVSATVVRYMVSFSTEGAALAAYTSVGELTGLTLSNTNILSITGQSNGTGAAVNDVVAKLGSVSYFPAA